MGRIGNHNIENDIAYANTCVNNNFWEIEKGLIALRTIHNATNKLVNHNGKVLNDVLGDKDVLRTYVLATFVELAEFIQVLPWKPWRESVSGINSEKLLDEFADILAFIGVLITILNNIGFTPYNIADAYIKKERINIERFKIEHEKGARNE